MGSNRLYSRFILWQSKNIQQKHLVMLLSFFIGLLSGLAAVVLKNTVHYTNELLTQWLPAERVNFLYFIYPLFGILLTVLFVTLIVKDNISHGVSRILFSISKRGSNLRSHNTYSSMVGSTLTVGFGGSVGLESPIVLTGAALGSTLGRMLRLNYKTITLLIGCGAAGAIAGIFKAPIAAIIFALEVLMLDLTLASIIPLLISSVTGAIVANFLLGKSVVFYFSLKDPFVLGNIPFYLLLGIATGLFSLYFTRGTLWVESIFKRISSYANRLLIGGIALGIMIFLFPPLYGEGYDTLRAILGGEAQTLADSSFIYQVKSNEFYFLVFLLLISMFKVMAMAVTNGSGGVGGIFAPTLFSGGILGYIFAKVVNNLNLFTISESNFALVGMAGVMAGVMHAPLTAIFLIAEITGGYELFIPLILTSTISYLTIMYFEPHSIYTKRLAARGELITHDKDQTVLTLMNWKREIEKDFSIINPDNTLRQLVASISKSKRNVFPVIDNDEQLVGLVLMDNIREIIFQHEMYDTTFVGDLMVAPLTTIDIDDSLEIIFEKFKETDAWNLPVVEKNKYLGFISKSRIFSSYRNLLKEVT